MTVDETTVSVADRRTEHPPEALFSVAWVSPSPEWTEALGATDRTLLPFVVDEFSLSAVLRSRARLSLVHLGAAAAAGASNVRQAFPGRPLVVELTGEAVRGRLPKQLARCADLVVVESLADLRELRRRAPGLTTRSALLRSPVDAERYAPEPVLRARRERDLRRLRRYYRLAGRVVLFAGPYSEAGGLDLLIDVVLGLRARNPDLRLVAVPQGPVDRRFLDSCERAALALGHNAVIRWATDEQELPLWFALANVVCLPCRAPVGDAGWRRAASSGTPFVGSEVDPLLELIEDGRSGYLVPIEDRETFSAALEALLNDEDEAMRMGRDARTRIEQELAPAPSVGRLVGVWTSVMRLRGERA